MSNIFEALTKVIFVFYPKMGRLSFCLSTYLKNILKVLQKNRELKVLKAGIVYTALFALVLSTSNVFAQLAAPTNNTPHMGYQVQNGANGQNGNQVLVQGGSCQGGTGANGGSPVSYTHLTLPTKA